MSDVVGRLTENKIYNTDLQALWTLIEDTSSEELMFCKLMGALGLSPYEEQRAVENSLGRIVGALGEELAMDLCQAASKEDIETTENVAIKASEIAKSSPQSHLDKLLQISSVPENYSLPAWRRGVQAANRVREKFGINELDPQSGSKFLEALDIDTAKVSAAITDNDLCPVTGAVIRNESVAQIGLVQARQTQRRFAAARAAYAAWASTKPVGAQLLTRAVTRPQQASRGFAAEMMAPTAFLRSRARIRLSLDEVQNLADELVIGADVVRNQAQNNGLQLYAA